MTWLNDGQLALAIDGQLSVNGQSGPPPFGSSQIEFYFNQTSKIGFIESSSRDSSYNETYNNLYLNKYINIIGNTGVGIGTTNLHGYALAVNGTIGTQQVIVTPSGSWPEYVFDKKYTLPKLDSVATYIAQNKHLPDVPSAATVAKDGIDLGGNQAVLLKKIEELTLYMIEQNKAIGEQNKTLLEQNKKIEQLEKKVRQLKKYLFIWRIFPDGK